MSEPPFLPPDQPTDNPPAKPRKSPGRVLGLWAVLIVVFVAIYHLVGSEGPGAGLAAVPDLVWSLGRGWPFLVAVGLGLFFFFQLRGGAKIVRELEPGLVALHEGRTEEAVRVFREVARRRRGQAVFAASVRYHLAEALVRLGELDEARAELVRVERAPGLPYYGDARALAAAALAEVAALKGEVELAERWLAEARKRIAGASQRRSAAAMVRFAETVLLCRRGEVERGRALLERDWLLLEGTLSVFAMRRVWLLRAFLEAQAAEPRDQSGIEAWLDRLRPFRSGELGPMAREWPALAAFLEAYGLS